MKKLFKTTNPNGSLFIKIQKAFSKAKAFLKTSKGKQALVCVGACLVCLAVIIGINVYIHLNAQAKDVSQKGSNSAISSISEVSDTSSADTSSAAVSSAVSQASSAVSSSTDSKAATSSTQNTDNNTNTTNQNDNGGKTAQDNSPSPAPAPAPAPAPGDNKARLASYGTYSYPYGVEETNAQFRTNEPAYNCDKVASDIIAQYASEGYTFDTNAGNVYCTGDGAACIRGKLSGHGQTHVVDVAWYYGQDGKYHHAIVVKLS